MIVQATCTLNFRFAKRIVGQYFVGLYLWHAWRDW